MRDKLYVGPTDKPDHYELGEAIASGGEATLHRGWVQGPDGRIPVAVKLLLPKFAQNIDRLLARWNQQVELLRTIRHPGIVSVRETFVGTPPHRQGEQLEGRQLYLVMDWVPGVPLDEWLLDHPDLNHLRRLRSVSQVADVLDQIHALRLDHAEAIVHRDVKPNNIIMGDNGPVLVDWGLVRGVVPDATQTPGEGGPGFMAPEVLREGRFSPASDRFSFACVVYFVLTGHYPPVGHDLPSLRARLLAVPGLANQRDTVAELLKMFNADPEQRPTSCREWLAGITRSTIIPRPGPTPPIYEPSASAGPLAGTAPWPLESADSGKNRNRLLAVGAIGALMIIVLATLLVRAVRNEAPKGTGAANVLGANSPSTTVTNVGTTTTVATTIPPAAPATTSSGPVTPPYPTTAAEAGEDFGVPDSVAHYQKVGDFGWVTHLSVTLKLYPDLCVDFDLNAIPNQVLTGDVAWVEVNSQMHRALMKGPGSIVGGATVYWSTCNHL